MKSAANDRFVTRLSRVGLPGGIYFSETTAFDPASTVGVLNDGVSSNYGSFPSTLDLIPAAFAA
jgi:hypothetical protein